MTPEPLNTVSRKCPSIVHHDHKRIHSLQRERWSIRPANSKVVAGCQEAVLKLVGCHEYADLSGNVQVDANRTTEHRITLERIANMAAESWWSGDLHIHRKPEDIERLMQAEDLNFAPVIDP